MNDGRGISDHPLTAIAVPAVTTAAGKAMSLADLQNWLTIASLSIGIAISLILAVKQIQEWRHLRRQWRHEEHQWDASTIIGDQDK